MTHANLQVTDYDAVGGPQLDDLSVFSAPMSEVLTQELDGACLALGLTPDEILLAALGRTIHRTIGGGTVGVDVPGYGTKVYPVALTCAGPESVSASELLASVHHTVGALSIHKVVYGVPADNQMQPESDVLFVYGDKASDLAGAGHLLELRAHRSGDVIVLDWRYDTRSFEAYTVEELAEQFSYGLIELTSEATAPILATTELAMAR
jgi:hypothetical protein